MKKWLGIGLLLMTLLFESIGVSVQASEISDVYYYHPLYRLYNQYNGEHFYTSSGTEFQSLSSLGWQFEGVAWISSSEGQEVYRLYNQNTGDHHYTLDSVERDRLVQLGWQYEGVSWTSFGDLPLYRLYNPNEEHAGSHHYTLSKNERDALIDLGWQYEGIAWYAIGESISVEDINENWEAYNGFLEGMIISQYV